MLVVKFQVNTAPGNEMAVKESLALYLETLGKVTFPKVNYIANAMVLTAHIAAKDGSVTVFSKMIKPYLQRFRDTKVLSLKECLPQRMEQMEFAGGI